MASEAFKKIATALREVAAAEKKARMEKSAELLQVAEALVLLREKVSNG